MAPRKLPPREFIRERFHYDRHTGVLRWKTRPRKHFKTRRGWKSFNTQCAGKIIGFANCYGHLVMSLNDEVSYLHRLIWKGMTGVDPDEIDHINGKKDDNRWVNLRSVPHIKNLLNKKIRRDNRVGLKGVNRIPSGKFRALIRLHGKRHHLGYFPTAEAAHEAYCRAAQALFGEYWSDGK